LQNSHSDTSESKPKRRKLTLFTDNDLFELVADTLREICVDGKPSERANGSPLLCLLVRFWCQMLAHKIPTRVPLKAMPMEALHFIILGVGLLDFWLLPKR
jgi:hypothetical protein